MIIFYNFFLTLAMILGFPVWIGIILRKKYRHGILRKLCLYNTRQNNKFIMVHAVSVGEINAAIPFIEKLKIKFPGHLILLTCSTYTGYNNANSRIRGCIIEYMPLDFYWTIKRFFKIHKIEKAFIFETELWPNFINICHASGIPIYIVNARISDRSYPKYLKFSKLLQLSLAKISIFFCQSAIDAERFKELGVDPLKIIITGNMKFDAALMSHEKALNDKTLFHIEKKPSEFIFLCGSTQESENLVCLEIYLELKKEFPLLKFILAPRKPDTLSETLNFLENKQIQFTKISSPQKNSDILIVDTIGGLFNLYRFADVVFIGKSLVSNGGGQNPIEPAVWGRPIIMGQSYENFREIVTNMIGAEAIKIVRDKKDLHDAIKNLLLDENQRLALGTNARQFVLYRASACDKILEKIDKKS